MSSSTTTTTTTAIPLTNLTAQQATDNATLASLTQLASHTTVTNLSASNTSTTISAPSTANQQPLLPRYANRSPTWSEKFANACSLANGLGTIAVLAAFIFGIGAWVGMKIQINQAGNSMELAIWTTCADHEAIQNSKLCKTIMAKDFSEFGKREATAQSKEMTVIVKRGFGEEDDVEDASTPKSEGAPLLVESRLSKYTKLLTPNDRSLIQQRDVKFDMGYENTEYPNTDAAIRATIFPFVHLLIQPVRWAFDFIESILLLIVYCIHKSLSWMTSIFIFLLQATLYNLIEELVQSVFSVIDQAIWEAMPWWMPSILTCDIASLLGLSALRSFWYSTNYFSSLKWILIFRVGMWLLIEGAKAGYKVWGVWKETVEQRRRNQAMGSQASVGSQATRLQASCLDLSADTRSHADLHRRTYG